MLKMKNVKKFAICMAATALLAVGTNNIFVEASAKDSYFRDFKVTATSFKKVTSPLLKEDNTSVYCYITSANSSVKAQTWGSTASKLKENLTLNVNGDTTTYVKLAIGTEYQIYNSIYEEGYKYAGLKVKSASWGNNVITGCWSADSVNTSGMKVASK